MAKVPGIPPIPKMPNLANVAPTPQRAPTTTKPVVKALMAKAPPNVKPDPAPAIRPRRPRPPTHSYLIPDPAGGTNPSAPPPPPPGMPGGPGGPPVWTPPPVNQGTPPTHAGGAMDQGPAEKAPPDLKALITGDERMMRREDQARREENNLMAVYGYIRGADGLFHQSSEADNPNSIISQIARGFRGNVAGLQNDLNSRGILFSRANVAGKDAMARQRDQDVNTQYLNFQGGMGDIAGSTADLWNQLYTEYLGKVGTLGSQGEDAGGGAGGGAGSSPAAPAATPQTYGAPPGWTYQPPPIKNPPKSISVPKGTKAPPTAWGSVGRAIKKK